MHRSFDCPHCRQHARVVAPPVWARGFVGVAWVVAAAMVFVAGMLGPFIMLVLPLLGVFAGGLVSGAHALAAEPPVCSWCGKIVAREAGVAAEPVRAPVRALA